MNRSNDNRSQHVEATSDRWLLARSQQGDNTCFEVLFNRYYSRVYTILVRLVGVPEEAEDLALETFLRLYRLQLTPDREHNIGAWLYRVATNLGYNALRSRARRKHYQMQAPLQAPFDSVNPADEILRRAEQSEVRATLALLNPRDVQLLELRYAGLSYNELAEVLEVAPGSVGALLARAEKRFRDIYVKQNAKT
jgi:RNA polymerase sigma-70 factor, ECF subfamily